MSTGTKDENVSSTPKYFKFEKQCGFMLKFNLYFI